MPNGAVEFENLQRAVAYLSDQVAQLKQRVIALEQGHPSPVSAPLDQTATAAAPRISEPDTPPQQLHPIRDAEPRSETLESQLGLTIVNRIGAITLAIGIIFFFKYAVDSKWITASGRVFLGLVSGLILIGVADWLRKRDQRVFSQGVCGCGLAILYISLYASFAYYQLVPQGVAFVAMACASAFAVILSFRYNHPAIAALGLVGAFLTPPLLQNGHDHPWILFPYLLILDVFSLGIAMRRTWPILHVLAFSGTAILFLAWASAAGQGKIGVGLLFLCLFFALFFVASIQSSNQQPTPLILLPFNAFWVLLSTRILAHGRDAGWMALLVLVLAAIHFVAAYRGNRDARIRTTLYVIGHACLLDAVIREIYNWGAKHIEPTALSSFLSESISVFLAVYAVAMISSGVARRFAVDRVIGLVVIGFVICKLYLYDVWLLTRFYRISAFVALGTLLLLASYVYSRFRNKLEIIWGNNAKEAEP
jgi:uncharacterized membrane protein